MRITELQKNTINLPNLMPSKPSLKGYINHLLITSKPKTPVNTRFSFEWGSRGRRFESSHPDHKSPENTAFSGLSHFLEIAKNGIKWHSTNNITNNKKRGLSSPLELFKTYSLSGGCCLLYCAVEMPISVPMRVHTTTEAFATWSA